MTNTTDELLRRLRARIPDPTRAYKSDATIARNPDGEDAAVRIAELEGERRTLIAALKDQGEIQRLAQARAQQAEAKVERFSGYDIMWEQSGHAPQPTPNGKWIRFSDHADLLTAAQADLREIVDAGLGKPRTEAAQAIGFAALRVWNARHASKLPPL